MSHSHILDTAIGGLIALCGTGIAQWFGFFSSSLERRQKHGELQRERLQKISDCIAESMAWKDSFQLLTSFDAVRDTPPSRCVRPSTMLARIYFPDLTPYALAYENCLVEYHVFAMRSYESNYKDACPVGVKMKFIARCL
jgi:hypothetical protein